MSATFQSFLTYQSKSTIKPTRSSMDAPQPKQTRVTRRHALSFASLIRSGLAVIAQRGLYETTVEHITEAADLGKGTFYAHFSSKDDLVQYLVQHGFDELISAGRARVPSTGTPASRLAALIRAQFQVLGRRRDLVILMHQVRGLLIIEPKARQTLRQEYQRYVDFLAEECQRILGRPRLRNGEAQDVACAIAGFVAGTLSFELLVRQQTLRRHTLAGPINAFAAGLAARYIDDGRPQTGARPAGANLPKRR
jgi:AcrR family transcriptional regulator